MGGITSYDSNNIKEAEIIYNKGELNGIFQESYEDGNILHSKMNTKIIKYIADQLSMIKRAI